MRKIIRVQRYAIRIRCRRCGIILIGICLKGKYMRKRNKDLIKKMKRIISRVIRKYIFESESSYWIKFCIWNEIHFQISSLTRKICNVSFIPQNVEEGLGTRIVVNVTKFPLHDHKNDFSLIFKVK